MGLVASGKWLPHFLRRNWRCALRCRGAESTARFLPPIFTGDFSVQFFAAIFQSSSSPRFFSPVLRRYFSVQFFAAIFRSSSSPRFFGPVLRRDFSVQFFATIFSPVLRHD